MTLKNMHTATSSDFVPAKGRLGVQAQKKGLRRVPTFVNLKSNTMKNIAKILAFYNIAKLLHHFLNTE